jgi:signal transduction histidine kinase
VRRRILLAILLAVAVTACALGIPLGYTALTEVDSITRQDLGARAEAVATIIDDQIASGERPNLDAVRAGLPPDGEILLSTSRYGILTVGVAPDNAISAHASVVNGGTVRVAAPAGPTRSREAQVAGFVLLLVVISVAVGTIVAIVTARRLARPLRDVAHRASRLGAGDFRADPARHDVPELDMVAETLDSSAAALASLMQRERDLVGDVSHQLRSRLTALQLRIEELACHRDPEVADGAAAALAEADRLTQVVDELLSASKRARAEGAEAVELRTELERIAGEWRGQLDAEDRSLRTDVPDDLFARATPARLREAIGVLLDNAVRHGDGAVTLSARRGEGTVLVEVSDQGTGVPDELAGHAFERGVSGHGSTGVGLALARALVDADGGRLEHSAAAPATFTVFLLAPTVAGSLGERPGVPSEQGPR